MKKYTIITGAIALVLSLFGVGMVYANSSFFLPQSQTAAATSSVSFLGLASSTSIVFDSFSAGSTRSADSATLLVQMVSSSSAAILNIIPSYSVDGFDYYDSELATTTTSNSITQANYFTLAGNAVSSTTKKIVSIPTPTRFVKITFTQAVATSSIYAAFVPLRQAIQ